MQIPAGKANPAPPIGPALGAAGVNIMAFCKEFNAKTQDMAGDILPVVITVYVDKTFTFIYKKPPVPRCLRKKLGSKKAQQFLTAIKWLKSPGSSRKIAEDKIKI